ncbi:MAG TPA: nitroreductase family deazaflavin-dependent oxidoreductase, partial [Acidimicrobiia bacterium]|nr:nitroreductase family deazaflavin-dependent oxidoreductase [Acidimicrobiia bacterium]
MPIPLAIARFNRYVTNPITRLFAGWAPMFAIVYHRGRRSGNTYNTPVNIFPTQGGFVIALTYGSNVDWVKNLLAAGEATIRYRSKLIWVTEPELISTEVGMSAMPMLVRF